MLSLDDLGWSPRLQAAFAEHQAAGLSPARVSLEHTHIYSVLTPDGELLARVSGRLRQRSYETKEGEKRTVYEVEVDDVGPSLRNASAKVNRASRNGAGGGQRDQGGPGGRSTGGGPGGGDTDPWASDSGSGGGFTDEPPF